MATELVEAPFSVDQIQSLNEYQKAGIFHPFTCGTDGCRDDLIATGEGWRCPSCMKHEQNWAHTFMADWSWKKSDWRNK